MQITYGPMRSLTDVWSTVESWEEQHRPIHPGASGLAAVCSFQPNVLHEEGDGSGHDGLCLPVGQRQPVATYLARRRWCIRIPNSQHLLDRPQYRVPSTYHPQRSMPLFLEPFYAFRLRPASFWPFWPSTTIADRRLARNNRRVWFWSLITSPSSSCSSSP